MAASCRPAGSFTWSPPPGTVRMLAPGPPESQMRMILCGGLPCVRCGVDCVGKLAIGDWPRGVPADPADPDCLACPLPDGARAGYPELPARNVEHVIGGGVLLGLHRENKHISPHPRIHAVFVACRIELPGAEAPEHQLRVPFLGPALQEGRALDLDRRPIGRLRVEVVPSDPQGALVTHRLGDQELRQDPAGGVVAQVAEGLAPELGDRGVKPAEALAAVQRSRRRGNQPGRACRLLCHSRSLRPRPQHSKRPSALYPRQ